MRSSFKQKLARQLGATALMATFLFTGLAPGLAQSSGTSIPIVGRDGTTTDVGNQPQTHVPLAPDLPQPTFPLVPSDNKAPVFGKGVPFHGSLPGPGSPVSDGPTLPPPIEGGYTPVTPDAKVAPGAPGQPQGDQLLTLRQALNLGKVKMAVDGDGINTTGVKLQLTSTTTGPIKVVIPANEVLHPNSLAVQTMVITNDIVCPIEPGKTAIVSVHTFCASPKSVPPPPQVTQGLDFNCGDLKDPATWAKIAALVAAGQQLETVGAFGKLLLPSEATMKSLCDDEMKEEMKRRVADYMSQNPTQSEAQATDACNKDMDSVRKIVEDRVTQREKQKRTNQITQLAIWCMLGVQSGKPEDAVTPDSITKDLIKGISQAFQRDKTLAGTFKGKFDKDGNIIPDEAQKKTFDQRSAAIFDLVDLTVRRSTCAGLTGVATLPKDDPCDTFCSVGERAFNQGDFTVAGELLTNAVKLAETFGEADARLSRGLNCLGHYYLNLTSYDEAQHCLDRALSLRQKVCGPESREVGEVQNNLGCLNLMKGQYSTATKLFDSAANCYEKATGKTSNEMASCLNYKGKAMTLDSKPEQGSATLAQAMSVAFMNCPQDVKGTTLYTPFFAEIETNMGDAECAQSKYKEAGKLYEKAMDIDTNTLGKEHPFLANILDGLANVTQKQGQTAEAEEYKKQAIAIRDRTLDTGSKEIGDVAALPLGTDDLGRLWHYIQGKKDFQFSISTVNAAAATPLQRDTSRMNKPIRDKWALVIGCSNFKDPSISLQYAAKDAGDFANYLVKEGNFAPDHVRTLLNEKATRAEILGQIGAKWLNRVAAEDDLVLIFFSSHGSPSSMDRAAINYLVAYDTDKTNLIGTGISLQDFAQQVKDHVGAQRVVLLMDACHSGAAVGVKGLFKELNIDAQDVAQGTGQLVICSSGGNQSSWESKRYKNGVFTHYLMEGLRHENNQGKLADVFDFMKKNVADEVREDRGAKQTPALQSKWEGNALIIGVKPADPHAGIKDGDPNAPPVVGAKTLIKTPAAHPAGTAAGGKAVPGAHKPVTASASASKSPVPAKSKPQVR